MVYGMAALGALAIYSGLPKEGKPSRVGLTVLLGAVALGCLAMVLQQFAGPFVDHVLTYSFALLSLAAAARVVTHPQPLYSALYFILVVISTAILIALIGATFLGAALVIVYAGAILVTYAFVIMLSQQSSGPKGSFAASMNYDRASREPVVAVAAGFVLIGTIAGLIVKRSWPAIEAGSLAETDNTLELGKIMLSDFAISVELGAVLLLVAMIGAIALAKKRIPTIEDAEHPPVGEIGKHVKPF